MPDFRPEMLDEPAFVSICRSVRRLLVFAAGENAIIEVIRYPARGEKPVADGHLLAEEDGPRFQAAATDSDESDTDSPMHNPYGRLKLISMKAIAENN